MTDTKFTRGPWEMQTPMGDNAPWIVRSGLQCYEWEPIATLGDVFKDLKPNSAAQKRILADAHLIAAGPTMYDALLEAECAVDQLCHGQHPENQCWVTLANIRTALSAARGDAS